MPKLRNLGSFHQWIEKALYISKMIWTNIRRIFIGLPGLLSLSVGVLGLKSWIPSTRLDDARNWNGHRVPVNCDKVGFDVTADLSLDWSFKNLIVAGLALPASGAVKFDGDATVTFANSEECPRGRDVRYERNEWKGWLDPANWRSDEAGEMWLPHSDRVPCYGEKVRFPSGESFAVELPDVLVPVGKINFEDEDYDGDEWSDFLNTNRGKSQFKGGDPVQIPWINEDIGCSGEKNCGCGSFAYVFHSDHNTYDSVPTSRLHEAVCRYAGKTCRETCYSPVAPEGHCCGVCGGVIKVLDTSNDNRFLERIRRKMRDLVRTESDDRVRYHVGRTLDGNVQVVILSESGDGTHEALNVAALAQEMLRKDPGPVISSKFSGLSLSGYFFNSTSGIIFGTLLAVLSFFACIYFSYVILPKHNIRLMTATTTQETPFRFARFKNATSDEGGSAERLEIGEEVAPETPAGFHNPTFSEPTAEPSKPSKIKNVKDSSEDEPRERQEYDNPTYHEMEKTRELASFEVSSETENGEADERPFREIEL